jgi:hypothetical protein
VSDTYIESSDKSIFIEQPATGLKLYARHVASGVELRIQTDSVHLAINLGDYTAEELANWFSPQLRNAMLAATARAEAAERERDALRAECEEWRENYAALEAVAIASERERKTAEAALAAVPVDAIRCYMRYSDVPDHHHRYPDAEQQADRAVIALWLAQQQPEVQP